MFGTRRQRSAAAWCLVTGSRVLLPQVYGMTTVTGQGNTNARAYASMNERAKDFAEAWLMLLGDGAAPAGGERMFKMVCDTRLVQCAQLHAEYLASRTGDQLLMSMHRGRDGSYANQRVLASGYKLPSDWPAQANYVESVARDGRDPGEVAISLAAHEGHRQHLLGIDGFEGHVVYGVGAAGDDYVCVICPPPEE